MESIMKIPKSIRIGGIEYVVAENEVNLNDGERLLYGQINYTESTIKLTDMPVSYQVKCLTLWHEILHGIQHASGMEIENEEAVVEMFSRGIYQVLQDNVGRLFDLQEVNNA